MPNKALAVGCAKNSAPLKRNVRREDIEEVDALAFLRFLYADR